MYDSFFYDPKKMYFLDVHVSEGKETKFIRGFCICKYEKQVTLLEF
jgi:hypothetical protein